MPEWNPRANDIFVRAAEIDAPADRRLFLEQQCGGDAALQSQVESLLAAGGKIGSFLEKPAVPAPPPGDATAAYRPLTEGPGTVIGPYKLLQHIGEGGFGAVYMAEQEHPVRRKVALKIIKLGMDTREVIARFESERQALAMMEHPNIARVFDAGATESGRPYFVMELVRGVPITEFCDKNRFSAEQRLKLFVTVCNAIQHAHHKGIIHRDIKPSNVMVTLHDGVPVVKVIDFGVAKATAQKLTERTLFTAYGQMIGTPAYMSPEQAEMSGLDIDMRSDIFSLGVLLYELLTGTTPLDSVQLRKAGYAEMQRLIREEEAPRPSTRFSSMGGEATVLATNRSTDVKRLSQLLRSDLDWIVMKSLDKDRNRRYGSPATFAADVERYLTEQPVEARPPSTWYRFTKMARRNKAALTTTAVVAAALVLGTAVSLWQAVRAKEAEVASRSSAEEAVRHAATADRERIHAEQERDAARAARAELRRTHYAVSMNLIQSAWDADNVPRVLELLDGLCPTLGEEDLRNFEWHYWDRLCHAERRIVPIRDFANPDGRFTSTDLSGDGTRFAWCRESPKGSDVKNTVHIVDTATGRELRTLSLPDALSERLVGPVMWNCRLRFNRDGSRLAVAATGLTVVVDTATGAELARIEGSLVSFSPDGKRLAAATQDLVAPMPDVGGGGLEIRPTGLKLFDLTSPAKAPVVVRCGPGEFVRLAEFNGDGSRLAGVVVKGNAGSFGIKPDEHMIHIWACATGLSLANASAGDALHVVQFAFSPDGIGVALLSHPHQPGARPDMSKGQVHLWRVAGDRISPSGLTPTMTFPRPIFLLNAKGLVFAPDSTALAVCVGMQRATRLIEVRDGTERQVIRGRDRVKNVAFTSEGTLLSVDDSLGTLREWGVTPPPPTRAFSFGGEIAVSSHAGDRTAAFRFQLGGGLKAGGGEIRVRGRDGKELHVFREHLAPLFTGVHFSPDDLLVLSSSHDGAVKIWKTDTGEVQWSFTVPVLKGGYANVMRQRFSLGDRDRLVALPTPTGMKVIEFDSLRDRFPLERAAEAYFSPDGRRLLSWHPTKDPLAMRTTELRQGRNSDQGELKLWDVATGKELWAEAFEELAGAFVFSPDARFFAITNVGREPAVEVRDATTGTKRFEIPSNKKNADYVFSPDGRHIVLSEWEAESAPPAVWDTATGKQLFRLEGVEGRPRCFYSPDGKRIVTIETQPRSGQARLWDAGTGRELLTLSKPLASPDFSSVGFTLTFSADGQRLVVPIDPLRGTPARTLCDATPRPEPK